MKTLIGCGHEFHEECIKKWTAVSICVHIIHVM